MYIYICIYTYIYTYIYMCVRVCVHVYKYAYTYIGLTAFTRAARDTSKLTQVCFFFSPFYVCI